MFSTYGAAMIEDIKANRDPRNSDVRRCRLGLDNGKDLINLIRSVQRSFVTAYISQLSNGNRTKRSRLFY